MAPVLATSNGAPVPTFGLTASQTAGPRGPVVLEDFVLIDHLAHFDHERTPERVVHAKGGGAFGYFEVTRGDISRYCKAKLFSQVGKRTPVAARFSTVRGEMGSADTLRDPRGFSVKFYTEEGNWDLVGNNTPIFFIRDAILFPSFIHTQKRLPSSHLRDDNMVWDFLSLRPESLHQQSFLFSDRGTPDGFRFMNGYGSNTFANVNAHGQRVFVKYHFKTDQGIRNLSVDEADALAGSHPDYAIRDLYTAIARKEYPTWTLYIQVMTEAQAERVAYAFDVTKVWPHSEFPLIEVGRLVLNRNPRNYFAEVEQLAFSPSHMVPGVEPSPDKMLQGRLFSYPDAHRHRLGVNYLQIPVNRPLAEPQTYQRDGPMAVTGNMYGAPNYFPNSKGGPEERADLVDDAAYAGEHSTVRKYSTADDDNFSQVRVFYNKTLNAAARERLTSNVAISLVNASKPVQARAVANFMQVDPHYAQQVRDKMDAMEKARAATGTARKSVHPAAPPNPPRKVFVPVDP